jgi:hypothetical protein
MRYFAQDIVPHLHTEQPKSNQQRRGNAWYCLISNEQDGIRPPENKFNSAMVWVAGRKSQARPDLYIGNWSIQGEPQHEEQT